MTEFSDDWFIFPMSSEIAVVVADTLKELTERRGLSLPEAVARINAQWGEQKLSSPTSLIQHETGFFWATVILFEEPIPDWWEGADRSSWTRRAAPSADSDCWTISELLE